MKGYAGLEKRFESKQENGTESTEGYPMAKAEPDQEPHASPWPAAGFIEAAKDNDVVVHSLEPIPLSLADARANYKCK
jgi:hypothetical protein